MKIALPLLLFCLLAVSVDSQVEMFFWSLEGTFEATLFNVDAQCSPKNMTCFGTASGSQVLELYFRSRFSPDMTMSLEESGRIGELLDQLVRGVLPFDQLVDDEGLYEFVQEEPIFFQSKSDGAINPQYRMKVSKNPEGGQESILIDDGGCECIILSIGHDLCSVTPYDTEVVTLPLKNFCDSSRSGLNVELEIYALAANHYPDFEGRKTTAFGLFNTLASAISDNDFKTGEQAGEEGFIQPSITLPEVPDQNQSEYWIQCYLRYYSTEGNQLVKWSQFSRVFEKLSNGNDSFTCTASEQLNIADLPEMSRRSHENLTYSVHAELVLVFTSAVGFPIAESVALIAKRVETNSSEQEISVLPQSAELESGVITIEFEAYMVICNPKSKLTCRSMVSTDPLEFEVGSTLRVRFIVLNSAGWQVDENALEFSVIDQDTKEELSSYISASRRGKLRQGEDAAVELGLQLLKVTSGRSIMIEFNAKVESLTPEDDASEGRLLEEESDVSTKPTKTVPISIKIVEEPEDDSEMLFWILALIGVILVGLCGLGLQNKPIDWRQFDPSPQV